MPLAGRRVSPLGMNATQRESLRELLRRVDEVRGLSERADMGPEIDPEDPGALLFE